MAVRARVSSGTGNSSPGNANLRIGTHADHDDDGHSDSMRKYVPRHASSISPTHDAVIAPFRRYVPPPGVIPVFSRHTCLPPRHSCAGRNLNARGYF